MKTCIALIALACGLLAAGCGSSGLQVANSGATTPVTQHSGVPQVPGLDAIAFPTQSDGWAGGRGAIIATTDGGANWAEQYSGGANISAFDFLDSVHGWAVASSSLLRTDNGGGTWTEAGEPDGLVLTSVEFTSAEQGWGVALPAGKVGAPVLGTLVKSGDGGATWSVVKQDAANSICVSGDALIAGAGGKVLRSSDGGETWSTLVDKGGNPITTWFTATVQCPDPSSIWVLFLGGAAAGSQGYAAYTTSNTGADWKPVVVSPILTGSVPELKGVTSLDSYPGPFDAVTGSDAVFTGQCPACNPQRVTVLATQDGGSSWARREVNGFYPTGLSFADPDHGWMTTLIGGTGGRRSAILATADGGGTWHPVYPS